MFSAFPRTHFPESGISMKLLMGSTIPKLGPTFPVMAAEAEIVEKGLTPKAVRMMLAMRTIPV
jgi:hypothetical protein